MLDKMLQKKLPVLKRHKAQEGKTYAIVFSDDFL